MSVKNFITFLALVVSVSSVFVSLARDEVRCFIGLNAEICQNKQNEPPESAQQTESKPSSTFRQLPNDNPGHQSLPTVDKALNSLKDKAEHSLPPESDKKITKDPTINENKQTMPSEALTVPDPTKTDHSEHNAEMEMPQPDQSISVSNPQEKPESSPDPSASPAAPIVPLKVEPYSPPSSSQ